jgi:hypothetical protein
VTAPAQTPAPGAIVGFATPDPVGATRPSVRDFVGRVIVVRPVKIERDVPNRSDPTKKQDRVTADVLVLDGGPLEFGGNVARGKPLTMVVQTPYLVKGMYISNTNMVQAVEAQVGRGVVLGRVSMGVASDPTHNPPFNLNEVPQDDPKYAAAVQVYTQVVNNVFVNPEPQRIGAASTPPAQQFAAITPAAVQQAQQIAQAPAQPDPQAAFAAWQAQQAAAAAAQQAPAASIPPAPSGWPEDTWRGLSDAQRAQILDAVPPFK